MRGRGRLFVLRRLPSYVTFIVHDLLCSVAQKNRGPAVDDGQ